MTNNHIDLQYEWYPNDGLICFNNNESICTRNFFYPAIHNIQKIKIIINLQNNTLSFENNDKNLGVATHLLANTDYGIFTDFSYGTIEIQDLNIVHCT